MRISIMIPSSHMLTPLSLLQLLPFLTLILALPVSSSTVGEGIGTDTHLTPTTFAPTIAQGLWFVEHYSPWCGHCKHFKPTWEKLVDEAGKGIWEGLADGKTESEKDKESGDDLKEVRMGSVDCSAHGDLCDANNIKGYPTLLMFHNGQVVDTFKGARELDDLKKFMTRHVRAVRSAEEEVKAKAEKEAKEKEALEKAKAEKEKEKAEKLKDLNANANTDTKKQNLVNPNGEVLALTALTFDSEGISTDTPPTFVKFFAPWCGHCKKLAPTWRLLAKHMQGKVVIAEVDCDAKGNKKLCEREGVEGYPTLVWYPGGAGGAAEGRGKGMVYEQGRKLEQLKAFAEKASSAGVQPISDAQELDKHIAEDDVVYLLLHSEGDQEIVNQIRNAASPLLGSPLILSSSSPALFSRYALEPSPSLPASHKPWAILALKDHDNVFPSAIFHGRSNTNQHDKGKGMDEAREWMMNHRLPSAIELTRDTFQSVMNAPQKPIVVLALSASSSSSSSMESAHSASKDNGKPEDKPEEKVMARLRDIGKKWRMRNRKRVFGDSNKSKSGNWDGDEDVFEGREVVFAWMDDGKWADWVKSMYGARSVTAATGGSGTLEDVRVVLADHANLVYYDTDSAGNTIRFTSSASIFAAVEDALRGRTAYKHSEGVVERMARYLNAKIQSLEQSVTAHPFRSFLVLLGVLGGVFWMLARFVGSDARSSASEYERGREEWREVKGRNGRLD